MSKATDRVRSLARRGVWSVFGDHAGLAVFLGALAFFGLFLRTGFSLNDSYTTANGLANLMHGSLAVEELFYRSIRYPTEAGGTATAPGMHLVDGVLYPEYIGQLALSVPFAAALLLVDRVADLSVALVGVWSVCMLGFCLSLGRVFGYRRWFLRVGLVVALVSFVGNVALATDVTSYWVYYLALQAWSMVAAALAAVVLYRLLADLFDRQTGLASAFLLVFATPLGLWTAVPLRHATTIFLAALAVYLVHLGRTRDDRYGLVAYVPAGLSAWVFAPEGVVLFGTVFLVRLLDPETEMRYGATAAVVLLSLVPFFVTNTLMSGMPLRPPLFLDGVNSLPESALVDGSVSLQTATEASSDPGSTPDSGGVWPGIGGQSGTTSVWPLIERYLTTPYRLANKFGGIEGMTPLEALAAKSYHTFLRSGYSTAFAGGGATNLALVESMPVAAVAAGLPVAYRSMRARSTTVVGWLSTRAGPIDLFAIVYTASMSLVYLPFLPLHAQFTVRYIVPVAPMLVYLSLRVASFRSVLTDDPTGVVWGFAGTVLVGGQFFVLSVVLVNASRGEAMQLYARVALLVAFALTVWVVLSEAGVTTRKRVGAALIGVTAGLTTTHVLLAACEYYVYSTDLVLPLLRTVAKAVSIV